MEANIDYRFYTSSRFVVDVIGALFFSFLLFLELSGDLFGEHRLVPFVLLLTLALNCVILAISWALFFKKAKQKAMDEIRLRRGERRRALVNSAITEGLLTLAFLILWVISLHGGDISVHPRYLILSGCITLFAFFMSLRSIHKFF